MLFVALPQPVYELSPCGRAPVLCAALPLYELSPCERARCCALCCLSTSCHDAGPPVQPHYAGSSDCMLVHGVMQRTLSQKMQGDILLALDGGVVLHATLAFP
eukprot:scpid39913/ scgid28743/ 